MKLIYRITFRISWVLAILLSIWAVLFYIAILDEVNDEVDDSLEDYSELLIIRTLAGQPLPKATSGSNNTYYFQLVSEEYAKSKPHIQYIDSMVYIPEKRETEPARILKTIFRDKKEQFWELTVSIPTIEKEDLVEAILHWIIILYVGLLITIILINVGVFYQSLRPFYKLLSWLDNYKIGGDNPPLESDTSVTEFKKLNETTLRYVGRTEQVFEQQKQFIGNASHEMQTPLAICNNRLEWLVDNTELTEEQLAEILKTKQTLNYLVKINKSLLFISKIENGQFPENSNFCFNSLIKESLETYTEIYEQKHITVTLDEQNEVYMLINESLAITLITNLLRNAFVHTPANGEVGITINTRTIIIENTSTSGSLDKEKIFERFYQGAKKQGSTGLGLSIVRSICTLYGLNISYDFISNKHRFTLLLKL